MRAHTSAFLFVMSLLNSVTWGVQPSQPSDDAWPLYARAIQRVQQGYAQGIQSPAASSLVYPGYPPYPKEWKTMETATYEFNAPARALVREARSRSKANWPSEVPAGGKPDFAYLNGCRALANEIADAAIEEHLRGDDAAAVESVRDLLHLAELLQPGRAPSVIQPLVALGIQMIAVNRLEIITAADVALTNDATDSKRLQVASAKGLIGQLFDVGDPAEKRFGALVRREVAAGMMNTVQQNRFLTQVRRGQAEFNLAAMSLACHLFQFDKHRWPASLDELTGYLSAQPRDAWGVMGYALIKSDRPNGPDRPLVYSRCNSRDGLFYPVDEPQFSYYPGPGFGDQRKQGGQFRDVTVWAPPHPTPSPTTRPLQ